MRRNRLRELLTAGAPRLDTHRMGLRPLLVEA